MIVYLIMIATLLVVFGVESVISKNGLSIKERKVRPNKFFIAVVFIILSFVAVFRYGVGTDFYAYYRTSNWVHHFERGNYDSPGFTLFAICCQKVFGNINGAITMGAALITIGLIVYIITKHSENLLVSILLFIFAGCFIGMFNGVRQYLATAILFTGHRFIINRKPIKWLLVVLLASTIHITAILMFFVYFICNLKCNWKLVGIYFIIAICLLFAYEPLFNLVGALKQDSIDTSDVYMRSSVNILRIAVQCIPIVLLLFVNKGKINNDSESRFLFNICLLNGALAIAAMNSPYFSRFWLYTSCFQILMYPKILNKMESDNKTFFTILLVVCYAAFWAYEVMSSSALSTFRWIFDYL